MECGEIRSRLPAFVLNESAGPERDAVVSHLGGCVECAAELRLLEAVPAALREWSDVEGSPPRRERLVGALVAEAGGRRAAGRRRNLRRGAAAAAVLLAAGYLGWRVSAPREPAPWILDVEAVAGSARVQSAGGMTWRSVGTGDRLREGDRLRVESEGTVRLRVPAEGRSGAGRLTVPGGTALVVGPLDRPTRTRALAIEGSRSGLYALLPEIEDGAYRIYDEDGHSAQTSGGEFELGFARVPAVPAALADPATGPEEEEVVAAPGEIAFSRRPLAEVSRAVAERTGRRVDVPAALADIRVSLSGPEDAPEDLWRYYDGMLSQRRIAVLPAGETGRFKLRPYEIAVAAPDEATVGRLTVRVRKGRVDLAGAGAPGAIGLADGQEASVAGMAPPAAAAPFRAADLALWAREMDRTGGPGGGAPVAVTGLTLRQRGVIEGKPLLEYEIRGGEVLARVGGARLETIAQELQPIAPDDATDTIIIPLVVRVRHER